MSAVPAKAEDHGAYLLKSAADLAELCGAPKDPSAIHMCQGFLVGTHRVFQAVGEGIEQQLYCVPDDGSVTRDSVARDLAAWIDSDTAVAGLTPHEAVLRWAIATHPCS
ncbi:MAG: Rap1a/Tai family immunity protein [Geminicoccaceae bacterium]